MTTGVALPDAPASIAAVRLFAAGGVDFTVADVARRVRLDGRDSFPAAGGPNAVEEAFRRARGLLTADQLTAWLERWAISPEDFQAWTGAPSAAGSWVAVVCSGALERAASEVATAAAAAVELGAGPSAASRFDPSGWADRLAARAVTDEDVRSVIAAHRLDWTAITAFGATTRDRGAAEELRHWVLDDGLELAIAATQAGCPTYELAEVLETVEPPRLRALLAGARPGELVGPVSDGTGWTVLVVRSRIEPRTDDPGTVARARAQLRAEILQRAVVRHVTA